MVMCIVTRIPKAVHPFRTIPFILWLHSMVLQTWALRAIEVDCDLILNYGTTNHLQPQCQISMLPLTQVANRYSKVKLWF